jgi:hypothetical protein
MTGLTHFEPASCAGAAAALTIAMTLLSGVASAQYEGVPYVWEGDPAVKAKLERWQDLKLGFMAEPS